jgi:hypothetical protein
MGTMTSREQLETALNQAQSTVRSARELAGRLDGRELRDSLALEAVALQCVVRRIGLLDQVQSEDTEELQDQLQRLRRLVELADSHLGTVH